MKPLHQQCCFAAALPHLILIGFVVSLLRDRSLPVPQTPYSGLSLEGLAILLTPMLGWWIVVLVGCVSLAGGLLGLYFHKATP